MPQRKSVIQSAASPCHCLGAGVDSVGAVVEDDIDNLVVRCYFEGLLKQLLISHIYGIIASGRH